MLKLLLLVCIATVAIVAEDKLELTIVLFRHGDRTPAFIYPNDPHKEDTWPEGLGQLTTEGMKQEYHLGELLKERYIDTGLMNAKYLASEVYVRSTDYERTLMSAQSVLAGMYPPQPKDEFEPGLKWRPVPVHTVLRDQDSLLPSSPATPKCPAYAKLLETDVNIIQIQLENAQFFQKLSEYTGMNVNVQNVAFLADTLYIEYINNLVMPEWFTVEILEKLQDITDQLVTLFSDTDEKKKFAGGVWVNQVMKDLEDKINGEEGMKDRKLILYSAHDLTMAAMFSVFDIYNHRKPLYSTGLIIELYSNTFGDMMFKNYYIKFWYRNKTQGDGFIAPLKKTPCNESLGSCWFNIQKRLMEQYRMTPAQWEEACSHVRCTDDTCDADTEHTN